MSLNHTTRLAPSSVFVRWKDLEPDPEVSKRSDPDPEYKIPDTQHSSYPTNSWEAQVVC